MAVFFGPENGRTAAGVGSLVPEAQGRGHDPGGEFRGQPSGIWIPDG